MSMDNVRNLAVGDYVFIKHEDRYSMAIVTGSHKRTVRTLDEVGNVGLWRRSDGSKSHMSRGGSEEVLMINIIPNNYPRMNIIRVSKSRSNDSEKCSGCNMGLTINNEFIPDHPHLMKFEIGELEFSLCQRCMVRLCSGISFPKPEDFSKFRTKYTCHKINNSLDRIDPVKFFQALSELNKEEPSVDEILEASSE